MVNVAIRLKLMIEVVRYPPLFCYNSYDNSKESGKIMQNEMMFRPVVDERVVEFMRYGQKPLTGNLREIQKDAEQNGIPIIPRETVAFLRFLLPHLQLEEVLEIGTAVGFSSSLIAEYGHCHVTTIDRFEYMINQARANYQKYGLEDQITLLEGQASDILLTLPSNHYDLLFMDSAKAKYIEFLPECLRVVKTGGMVMIDDILQAGTVFDPDHTIKRGARKIHRRLIELLEVVNEVEGLTSTIVPLGDGLLMITKEKEDIQLPPLRPVINQTP